jgi:signal recognition particle receptor subunit beta
MQVNETQFLKEAESKAPIRLVDIPGHPRIRAQFTEHLSSAKGVIFVVDTMTVTRNAMSTAE